ncbi:MAG: hypothetical protein U0802_24755 [Candidatus Binatia bacterium]
MCSPPSSERLPTLTKSIYGLGDMTINTALAALALVYTSYFLTQVVPAWRWPACAWRWPGWCR